MSTEATITTGIEDIISGIQTLSAPEAATLWLTLGQLLAAADKEELAKLMATCVIKSSYGNDEEKSAWLEFGQAYAMATSAIVRDATVRKWQDDMETG